MLANAYGWLADTYFLRSQWRQSLDTRRKQLAISEVHRADPANLDATYRYALAQRAVADFEIKLGQFEAARPRFSQANDIALDLTRRDERNIDWQLLRAYVDCDLFFYVPELSLPAHLSRRSLLADVLTIEAFVRSRQDPRLDRVIHCRAGMQQRLTPQ